jgi:hypothetical protein
MRLFSVLMVFFAALATASGAEPTRSEVLGRADLPAKVEDTFERQAAGRGLEQIRRVVDSAGRTSYVARVVGTGKLIEATPDGSLRSAVPSPAD